MFSTKKIIIIRRRTCIWLCIGIMLVASLWLVRRFYQDPGRIYIGKETLQQIQVSSTEFPYFSFTSNQEYITLFSEKGMHYRVISPTVHLVSHDLYTFTFRYTDQQEKRLHYSPTLNEVYNMETQLVEPSLALKEVLLDIIGSYRQEIDKRYGALLVWDEVDSIFQMYATAKITDIYTGASFNVQRREGCSHVDAQPLTAKDTAIMKEIFDGRWSWERKGIIVHIGDNRIAASMNGMPHGGGKIDDNNFPGHFCIHFLGSTIHNGGMDIQHHREILKAAGKLPLED